MAYGPKEILLLAFHAYNAHDVDGLLAMVTPDVNWPSRDKRLHGPEALKDYWLDQWRETSTHDQPIRIDDQPDGRLKVFLNQVVRTVDGKELSRGAFEYLFELRGGLIARLDILQ